MSRQRDTLYGILDERGVGLLYECFVDDIVCFYDVDALWKGDGEVALSFCDALAIERVDFDRCIF